VNSGGTVPSKSGSNRPISFGTVTRNACPQMGERKYNTF
jgi:hypothetical protein